MPLSIMLSAVLQNGVLAMVVAPSLLHLKWFGVWSSLENAKPTTAFQFKPKLYLHVRLELPDIAVRPKTDY